MCVVQSAAQHSFFPSKTQSAVSVTTNPKPCHLPIPHFTVIIIGRPYLWHSACCDELSVFTIWRVIRLFIALFVGGEFWIWLLCNAISKHAFSTYVSAKEWIPRFLVCLLFKAELFIILCAVCCHPLITSLSLLSTEDEGCVSFWRFGNDLPG
jgi:hypothetical protein